MRSSGWLAPAPRLRTIMVESLSQSLWPVLLDEVWACLRANGVPNFPDPKAGGGFRFQAGAGIDPSSSGFKAARVKCQKLLPGGRTVRVALGFRF